MSKRFLAGGLVALIFLSCGEDAPAPSTIPDTAQTTTPAAPEVLSLSPTHQALRVAMSLRGVRPTVGELNRVENSPGALADLVDDWMDTPEFGATVRDIHHEIWKMRSDITFYPTVGALEEMGANIWEVNRDVYEAPLRLIEDIVANDLPYTSILTADYLLANDIVATVWDVEEHPAASGSGVAEGERNWRRMRWADKRPKAGILSSSALFERHRSNGQNYNRGRAQTVANALLCHDFLNREIPIDGSVDVTDSDALAVAVVENPTCASCHQTLDPLASFFWGHRGVLLLGQIGDYPVDWYETANESKWQQTSKRPTGFYGDLGGDLKTLGEKIAEDPRFVRCTVERFWSWFNQEPPSKLKFATREVLIRTLVESGYNAKALVKGIVLDPDFHRAYTNDEAYAEEMRGYLKLRPDQLVRLFDSLLNFRWISEIDLVLPAGTLGKVELIRSEVLGFRSLFGGIDGYYASAPVHTASITSSLVLEQISSHASERLVQAVFAGEETSELLSMITAPWSDEDTMRSWLVDLHFRLYADRHEKDSDEITASYELLTNLEKISGDPVRAWTGLLHTMMRDPRMIYY